MPIGWLHTAVRYIYSCVKCSDEELIKELKKRESERIIEAVKKKK